MGNHIADGFEDAAKSLTKIALGVMAFVVIGATVFGYYVGKSGRSQDVPEVQRTNVIGGQEPELYMERDGTRFYAEVDGRPVGEYSIRNELSIPNSTTQEKINW